MSTAPLSTTDWPALLAAEQARREQAEAALAVAQDQLLALEAQLAATAASAQRHHTQLAALVHNLHVGLLLVDHEQQIQFVNQHFWALFGLKPVPGLMEGQHPIPHPAVSIDRVFADPAAFRQRARAMHAAAETVLQEVFVLADGRVLELDYLVLDTVRAGRLICYRDVTERHQRDEEIRTLFYISQQNPNPILRLTPEGEVLYANPAAARLLQALANDAAGALLHQLRTMVHAALRSPEQQQQELAVAGEHYLFTAEAVPGQPFATLYLTNITTRQRAEQQLAEQRAFYESVLEQLPIALAVFDAGHRYLFVNPVVEPDPAMRARMMGKTSEEACALRGRPLATVRQRAAAFAEAGRTRQEVTWEETRPSGAHGMQSLEVVYRPVLGPEGELRVISAAIDITAHKEADEKMQQQREFYESILNLLPVEIVVFDADFRCLFVNATAVADPGLRRRMLGLRHTEYFHLRAVGQPEGVAASASNYFALAARTSTDVEWEEMLVDGRQRSRLMLRHLRPVLAADGVLRLMVGSGLDITARYAAEKLQHEVQTTLRLQQAFTRQILDALPNVVYMVDPDSSVSFSNHAYETMIAHNRHWQKQGVSEAIVQEMRQMQELNLLVRASRQVQVRELPFTLKSGETMYYQVHKRPLLRADGQIGVLTVSIDVTAMKRARQELERREKQYHDLVYFSQALICTHDEAGQVLTVNPAVERVIGLPAAFLVGRHLREALPPEHHSALQAYLDGRGRTQEQPLMVAVHNKRTGERRYLQYYTYRVVEEGLPTYVVASGYDITAGVLAQRALQQAKREADENARAKEAFLARMSHEIRTPLNGVLGMAGLLRKTPLTPEQQEYLNTMQHAGQHLLALLNNVLDMAKITTGHLALQHAPFDLALALQGAGQAVAVLAAEKGLGLLLEPLRVAEPRVVGDAYRLHQVLLNLLSNAIKFTERGRVRLGAEVLADTGPALRLRFWVQDTGIGILPEEQATIFDAFAQASGDTSMRFGGTGLGLAISGQLVEQMGGILQLCSEAGRGTTFSFQLTLPRAGAALALLPTAVPASYGGLRGLRVLLAEDNLVNQQIAVAMLEYWGVEVLAVANGRDALALLQQQRFDAALLDIRMPGLSGVEVTTAIRAVASPAHARVPIIALTANAFEADRLAYLTAGMNACLTKPYEEAALCQLLLELTAR